MSEGLWQPRSEVGTEWSRFNSLLAKSIRLREEHDRLMKPEDKAHKTMKRDQRRKRATRRMHAIERERQRQELGWVHVSIEHICICCIVL